MSRPQSRPRWRATRRAASTERVRKMSPKTKSTKPIDIYVRVSQVGGRDGDSFISPEVQEQRCRAQLEVDGLTVGKVFLSLIHI